jgi:hypothetical protein
VKLYYSLKILFYLGYFVIMAAASRRDNDLEEQMIPKKEGEKENESGNYCQKSWKWFKKDPINRWPFCLFALLFPLGIFYALWHFISASESTYVAAGSAVAISSFGVWHFRILMSLKEQVDKLHKLNLQFRVENTKMKQEVARLSSASTELSNTRHRLHDCNERNRENIKKFQQLSNNLKTIGGANADSMSKIKDLSNKMKKKME